MVESNAKWHHTKLIMFCNFFNAASCDPSDRYHAVICISHRN